ncbi:hypothetical protein N7497_011033, partial [Penicillium chrysogenum]
GYISTLSPANDRSLIAQTTQTIHRGGWHRWVQYGNDRRSTILRSTASKSTPIGLSCNCTPIQHTHNNPGHGPSKIDNGRKEITNPSVTTECPIRTSTGPSKPFSYSLPGRNNDLDQIES